MYFCKAAQQQIRRSALIISPYLSKPDDVVGVVANNEMTQYRIVFFLPREHSRRQRVNPALTCVNDYIATAHVKGEIIGYYSRNILVTFLREQQRNILILCLIFEGDFKISCSLISRHSTTHRLYTVTRYGVTNIFSKRRLTK